MAKVNLLTSAEREGEIITPPYLVSNTVKDVCGFCPIFLDKDLNDPNFSFSLTLYTSEDGVKWRYRAGMTGVGNNTWKEPPSLGIPPKDLKGKYVQVGIEPNKKVEVGITFEDKDKILFTG